jgi:predicted RNA-binding Zn-ribbon protein involved in translation (DUF1610 family)
VKFLIFPGASLMEITPLDDGVHVRCPGCGAVRIYRDADHRGAFLHEDGCPIFARIQRATEQYERNREG